MIERRQKELKLVETEYGELEFGVNLDWFNIKCWNLIPGWNKPSTNVLVLIPSGYPVTPPDSFYTDHDLRLANGGQPGSSTPAHVLGKNWVRFSFHLEPKDWRPHADPLHGHNLLTFVHGVAMRLSEVS